MRQSGPFMAAIVGLGGPSTATQFAVDGPGDLLGRDISLSKFPTYIGVSIHMQ